MKAIRIKKTGKQQLRRASRLAMESSLTALNSPHMGSRWIRKTNRYRIDCVRQYKIDTDATPPSTDHSALVEYVAASSPGHVIDGWSLLGRAIDATLRCDSYAALHLAYYAELRGAMGLLASEGVGIFNNRHATIDAQGLTSRLPQTERWNQRNLRYDSYSAGTHDIVWPCLQHWASLQKAYVLLNEIIRPGTIPLSQWLGALGAITRARAIAESWLREWGLDLSILEDDHESRNFASYRPSEFRLPPSLAVDDVLEFVKDLWLCLEPGGASPFPTLEKHLLKRAVFAAKVATPVTSTALGSLGLPDTEIGAWLSVLNSTDEPRLFSEAETQSRVEDSRCHLQVISRAVLLLSLATVAVRRLLAAAGYTRQDLRFWWLRYSVDRGLCEQGITLDNPLDLWADVREGLSDLQDWQTSNGPGQSLRKWRRDQSHILEMLGAFELIAVWGIVP